MNRIIHTSTLKLSQLRQRRQHSRIHIHPSDTAATAAAVPSSLHTLWHYQILEPDSGIVTLWNHVFLLTCLIALFIDPLYFFLPTVAGPACITTDTNLKILVTVFRTFTDLFYLLHVIMKFRTAFIAPNSRVFGRGELVMDAHEIAHRYLRNDFVIDLAATLPLPQIVNWLVIPATKSSRSDHANNTLALMVLIQYIPRMFLIFPLHKKIVKNTGIFAKTAWAGAVYNLILYMLASHVLGASWYVLSIGRQFNCWSTECDKENMISCIPRFLDCGTLQLPERQYWLNLTHVLKNCDPRNSDNDFKFGMFEDAFTNDVASSRFIVKYLYCLWWGFKNLSSYGQNLETTIYLGETLFAIFTCIAGLILFSLLIGNMQTYLASIMVRVEEWRVKRRDIEEWMRHRQLPPVLQERVRRFVQYKWLTTRGVDEESILESLPLDLRREIQQHLCLDLVRRVPFFSQMDGLLLDAICGRLVSSLSTQGTYVMQEGDPVNEMLFIIRGRLESSTTDGGRLGFFNSITLRPGDFCGEELLTWALMPNPSLNLPLSTRTVRALSEVEAFALGAEDLKYVANQFKRLHSKKLQHAFRYYSHQWRTWGACFIQAAWRRHAKRKLVKELTMQESMYSYGRYDYDGDGGFENAERYDRLLPDNNGNNPQHLGATILASKFAANTKKGTAHKIQAIDPGMPKLFKPDEPDFNMAPRDEEV
ncbi:hypothetical protein SAY87_004022 [Trapa incisa]|uniref:Cyclic nucleotide-binding domain-containing protein n=1 Tax=Trapa incisa TaxID=236973 RepID=A0AAN7JNA2_9MYRT|nr:hypothetical protein SAY87_004022 [Trapa incisa]